MGDGDRLAFRGVWLNGLARIGNERGDSVSSRPADHSGSRSPSRPSPKVWPRAPILHRPDEQGLDYEDVFFPSADGTPLEGWFISRRGSDKIIIANHSRWFNRAGLPSHLESWKSLGGSAGYDFEVNFVPDYKILHEAGYNDLAYDLRNFGQSGAANGGVFSVVSYESRDVIGSLSCVRGRTDTCNMTIGLFATALAATPPCSRCMVLERFGIPASYIDDLNERIRLQTSFTINQFSPVPWAKSVRIPTFL
jgi:uncharacterized protein